MQSLPGHAPRSPLGRNTARALAGRCADVLGRSTGGILYSQGGALVTARAGAGARATKGPPCAAGEGSHRRVKVHAVVSAASAHRALARRELEDALPPGAAVEELAPGVWLCSAPGRFADLSRALWATVFVQHACPADVEVPLPTRGDMAGWVAEALLPAVEPLTRSAGTLQVQARILQGAPRWHPGALAACARSGLPSATGRPTGTVLSLTVAPGRALAGVGPVALNLSPWPGGVARLRARPGELARSARKLEEAMEVFSLRPPAGAHACDLGAAPGGWTRLLLDAGLAVTAIDTAALHPSLAGTPGLTVLRGSALSVPVPAGPFDLLTADLSWEPLRAAACAVRFRSALARGAAGVFTIKLFGGDPLELIGRVRARLEGGGFRVQAVRHLYHNRDEATALLRA